MTWTGLLQPFTVDNMEGKEFKYEKLKVNKKGLKLKPLTSYIVATEWILMPRHC